MLFNSALNYLQVRNHPSESQPKQRNTRWVLLKTTLDDRSVEVTEGKGRQQGTHPSSQSKPLKSSTGHLWSTMNFETVACTPCIGSLLMLFVVGVPKWDEQGNGKQLSTLYPHALGWYHTVLYSPVRTRTDPRWAAIATDLPKALPMTAPALTLTLNHHCPLIHSYLVLLIQEHCYSGQSHRINKAETERAAFPSASSITSQPGSWTLLHEFHFSLDKEPLLEPTGRGT